LPRFSGPLSRTSLVFAGLPLGCWCTAHPRSPRGDAEFFQARFPQASNPIVRRLLRLQERASIAFALVLTVNDALGQRLIDLGVPPTVISAQPISSC
jgi:hypothetical protein